jgi:hypothetical protein
MCVDLKKVRQQQDRVGLVVIANHVTVQPVAPVQESRRDGHAHMVIWCTMHMPRLEMTTARSNHAKFLSPLINGDLWIGLSSNQFLLFKV